MSHYFSFLSRVSTYLDVVLTRDCTPFVELAHILVVPMELTHATLGHIFWWWHSSFKMEFKCLNVLMLELCYSKIQYLNNNWMYCDWKLLETAKVWEGTMAPRHKQQSFGQSSPHMAEIKLIALQLWGRYPKPQS